MTLPGTSLSVSSWTAPATLIPRTARCLERRSAQRSIPARSFTPAEGKALEMLGHAIEYLVDEYTLECRSCFEEVKSKAPQVIAIEILMASSRQLYLGGQIVPSFVERFREWLGLARA